MKAIQAVILEPHKTGLREVEISDPAPDQFLVQTKVSAISAGTELAVYTGSHQWLKDPSMPDWKFPFRPGYSAAGVYFHHPDGGVSEHGARASLISISF